MGNGTASRAWRLGNVKRYSASGRTAALGLSIDRTWCGCHDLLPLAHSPRWHRAILARPVGSRLTSESPLRRNQAYGNRDQEDRRRDHWLASKIIGRHDPVI